MGEQPGAHIASCGHRIFDEGESVAYASWDCDAVFGFHRCVSYATYCPGCALKMKVSGYYLPTEDAELLWLNEVAS